MQANKLVITSKKFRGDSAVVSVRLPNEMIEQLDAIAARTGRARNEIIQKCLAFSIENIEVTDNN
jgi:predicted DNA-binding protein